MRQLNESWGETKGCANCNNPVIAEGYPTPLCTDCRQAFVKFPIPNTIKIFAGVIGLVFLFAMVKAPSNLSAGIHLQRGKDAMKKGNYYTAQKEFEKVIKAVPRYTGVKEYMTIASFYNQDITTFLESAKDVVGKEVQDQDMFAELNAIMEKSGEYLPSDSFMTVYERYGSFDSIPDTAYKRYEKNYPDELYPFLRDAGLCFDRKEYVQCDSLLNITLNKDDNYLFALNLKAGLKREFKQFDSAQYYSDKLLSLNKESTYGICSRSRIFLQQGKDKEGLQWALKAADIDKTDPYVMATLALAYHYNNNLKERDKLFEATKNDSVAASYMKFTKDVVSGKEQFR